MNTKNTPGVYRVSRAVSQSADFFLGGVGIVKMGCRNIKFLYLLEVMHPVFFDINWYWREGKSATDKDIFRR
jgi:hypothetical protein